MELIYLWNKMKATWTGQSKFCVFKKHADMHLPYSTVIAVKSYSQGLSRKIELINLHVQKLLSTKKYISK